MGTKGSVWSISRCNAGGGGAGQDKGIGVAAQVVGCGSKQDGQGRPRGQGDSGAKTVKLLKEEAPVCDHGQSRSRAVWESW